MEQRSLAIIDEYWPKLLQSQGEFLKFYFYFFLDYECRDDGAAGKVAHTRPSDTGPRPHTICLMLSARARER